TADDGCFRGQAVAAVDRAWGRDDNVHHIGQVAVLDQSGGTRQATTDVGGSHDTDGHALDVRVADDQVAGHVIAEPDPRNPLIEVGKHAGVAACREAVDHQVVGFVTEEA